MKKIKVIKTGCEFLKVLIIDDEKSIVDELTEIILEKNNFQIFCASSSMEFNSKQIDLNSIDIAFIDIMLENECGINLGCFFHQKNPDIKIIYISGYPEMVADVFLSVDAIGFIDKPIRKEKVYSYIEKALNKSNAEFIKIPFHGKEIQFYQDSILYVESEKRDLVFHLADGKSRVFGKLDEIEKLTGKKFVRCHKSFLVNAKYITCIESAKFRLINGECINISRTYRETAMEKYYKFKGGIIK